MSESEILCRDCEALCCYPKVLMRLTNDEAQFLKDGGANLKVLCYPTEFETSMRIEVANNEPNFGTKSISVYPGYGVYLLEGKCGYLEEDKNSWLKCNIYEDPRCPKTCRDFAVGDVPCQDIRSIRSSHTQVSA